VGFAEDIRNGQSVEEFRNRLAPPSCTFPLYCLRLGDEKRDYRESATGKGSTTAAGRIRSGRQLEHRSPFGALTVAIGCRTVEVAGSIEDQASCGVDSPHAVGVEAVQHLFCLGGRACGLMSMITAKIANSAANPIESFGLCMRDPPQTFLTWQVVLPVTRRGYLLEDARCGTG
jgi:hypothetical protein